MSTERQALIATRFLAIGSGHLAYAGCGFFAVAVAGRTLGPETYGLFTIFMAAGTLGTELFDLGVSKTLARFGAFLRGSESNSPTPSTEVTPRAVDYYRFIVRVYLYCSLPLISLLIVMARMAQETFRTALFGLLTGYLIALGTVLIAVLQAERKFGQVGFFTGLPQALKLILFALAAAIAWLSLNSAVAITILCHALVCIVILAFHPTSKSRPTPKALREMVKELWRFGQFLALGSIFAALYQRIDVFLLAFWVSKQQVGIYGAAFILGSTSTLVAKTAVTYLVPELSYTYAREGAASVGRFFHRVTNWQAIVGFFVLSALAAIVDRAVKLLFGTGFEEAATTFLLLLPYMLLNLLYLSTGSPLLALGRTRWIAVQSAIVLTGRAASCSLLIPILGGPQGAAAGMAIGTGAGLLYGWKRIHQVTKVYPDMRTLGACLASALLGYGVVVRWKDQLDNFIASDLLIVLCCLLSVFLLYSCTLLLLYRVRKVTPAA